MREKIDSRIPRYGNLIDPTFQALKVLGGSGKNDEILEQIIQILNLPDEVVDISHKGSSSMTELAYQAAWSRTYMRAYGVIENSARSVWSIKPNYVQVNSLNGKDVIAAVDKARNPRKSKEQKPTSDNSELPVAEDEDDVPEEVKPWRIKLAEILQGMDPFAFERLAQRILRECGFSQVEVTKKTGDGGIDGTGKLKINGIFSFNVAFQCKRYSGLVGAGAIRDFRGSLTTDIEKGVLITTGAFSKSAREEASNPGKQQIDLIDGEELIGKIAEYGIGVREVKTYEVDEEFFDKI